MMTMDTKLHFPKPVLTVDLFPAILSGLTNLLRGLSASEWQKPTACPGWTVKDVAGHLLGVEIGNLSRRRDRFGSRTAFQNETELLAYINDLNQSWASAAGRISPRLLVDLLELTASQICTYFRELDPYAIGGVVSWAGPEPAQVWLDIAREYTERWHHQQHIRDAVGQPGFKQPKFLAPVLATFIRALPVAYQSSPGAEGAIMTVTIGGEAGGRWSVVRQGVRWNLFQGGPLFPTAEAVLDQDLAWRLWTRGVSPEAVVEKIEFRGDPDLAKKVLEMVSIIA